MLQARLVSGKHALAIPVAVDPTPTGFIKINKDFTHCGCIAAIADVEVVSSNMWIAMLRLCGLPLVLGNTRHVRGLLQHAVVCYSSPHFVNSLSSCLLVQRDASQMEGLQKTKYPHYLESPGSTFFLWYCSCFQRCGAGQLICIKYRLMDCFILSKLYGWSALILFTVKTHIFTAYQAFQYYYQVNWLCHFHLSFIVIKSLSIKHIFDHRDVKDVRFLTNVGGDCIQHVPPSMTGKTDSLLLILPMRKMKCLTAVGLN